MIRSCRSLKLFLGRIHFEEILLPTEDECIIAFRKNKSALLGLEPQLITDNLLLKLAGEKQAEWLVRFLISKNIVPDLSIRYRMAAKDMNLLDDYGQENIVFKDIRSSYNTVTKLCSETRVAAYCYVDWDNTLTTDEAIIIVLRNRATTHVGPDICAALARRLQKGRSIPRFAYKHFPCLLEQTPDHLLDEKTVLDLVEYAPQTADHLPKHLACYNAAIALANCEKKARRRRRSSPSSGPGLLTGLVIGAILFR